MRLEDRWVSCDDADEWSDVLVGAMALGGVENIFFVSGAELAFYQEAVAKAKALGRSAPSLVTVTHENVALNAAIGNSMVRRAPAVTAVHVDAGTLHQGAAVHAAWRGGYPVLMTAGTGPRGLADHVVGGRDRIVQALQEPRDQNAIVRQYTKADHRLESQDHPGYIVSRLLQLTATRPAGPTYLSIPREVAALPAGGLAPFPTVAHLGIGRAAAPDPADIRAMAQAINRASRPLICLERSGDDPASVPAIVSLAEELGMGVSDVSGCRMNFPMDHWAYQAGGPVSEADFVLVLDAVSPFVFGHGGPAPEAEIAWVGTDPVLSRYKTTAHRADWWITADPELTVRALLEAACRERTRTDCADAEDRRTRLKAQHRARVRQLAEAVARDAASGTLTARLVADTLGRVIGPDALLLNDGLSNGELVRDYCARTLPGTYFRSGSTAGGWGAGAAFGAKLAAPDVDVVHATGDGYFMFGSPLSALWAAEHHGAPYLTVVFVNGGYSTGTAGLLRAYPDGYAVRRHDATGGVFEPPPDFAKLAEAARCWGVTVKAADDLEPALRRALQVVRSGTPAVLAAELPRLGV